MAEVAVELVGGIVEYALEWLGGDGKKQGEQGDHDAIGRYVDSLYEERPLPPANPQDLNR